MRHSVTVDIIALEAQLLAAIDAEAEAIRGLFITNTPSQPSVYLQKEQEAERFMADQNVSLTLIPNLLLEAERTEDTVFNVAATILTMAYNWRQISATIENLRLGAKDQVRIATTVAGKRAAAKIDWAPIQGVAVSSA